MRVYPFKCKTVQRERKTPIYKLKIVREELLSVTIVK